MNRPNGALSPSGREGHLLKAMSCELVPRFWAAPGRQGRRYGTGVGVRTKAPGRGQLRGQKPGGVPDRRAERSGPRVPCVHREWCLHRGPGRARAQGRARPLVVDRFSAGSQGPAGPSSPRTPAPACPARAPSRQRREMQPRPLCVAPQAPGL